ncbi:hypothetical protein LTR29_012770 [Friedmanniomyces endolithicus]|nr:hypothetical protein LTR29_012770 [Friedmanniomyces endolithicus]
MTLAELIEHGEVSEADRATEKAPSMQVSGGKMEDKTKNNEQLHATIARLQAELAAEREKVKEARRELAEESKRLRRCEWKLKAREAGSNVWLDELEQQDEALKKKDEEMERLRHEVGCYKEAVSRVAMELTLVQDKIRRGE